MTTEVIEVRKFYRPEPGQNLIVTGRFAFNNDHKVVQEESSIKFYLVDRGVVQEFTGLEVSVSWLGEGNISFGIRTPDRHEFYDTHGYTVPTWFKPDSYVNTPAIDESDFDLTWEGDELRTATIR